MNAINDIINASAKEEAEETTTKIRDQSFEKYLKNANLMQESRTSVRRVDSSRLGDRSSVSSRFKSNDRS